jgi:hypothetical protein
VRLEGLGHNIPPLYLIKYRENFDFVFKVIMVVTIKSLICDAVKFGKSRRHGGICRIDLQG